jgi:hypothetical protein
VELRVELKSKHAKPDLQASQDLPLSKTFMTAANEPFVLQKQHKTWRKQKISHAGEVQ